MEDKGKELRKNALNEDELNDVAGGECIGPDFEGIKLESSWDWSGDKPKYSVGMAVEYTCIKSKKVVYAVIDSISADKKGIFGEFVYKIHLEDVGSHGESGECYEHQIKPLY